MRNIFIGLFAVSLAGCVVGLEKSAQNVRITSNPNVVSQCKFIGQLEADSIMGGFALQGQAAESVNNQLRNKANEIGANTVFANIQTGLGGTYTTGEAYKC